MYMYDGPAEGDILRRGFLEGFAPAPVMCTYRNRIHKTDTAWITCSFQRTCRDSVVRRITESKNKARFSISPFSSSFYVPQMNPTNFLSRTFLTELHETSRCFLANGDFVFHTTDGTTDGERTCRKFHAVSSPRLGGTSEQRFLGLGVFSVSLHDSFAV